MQSTPTDIEIEVLHGSMIGPTDCTVNINDMDEKIDFDLYQFADESTIYTTG